MFALARLTVGSAPTVPLGGVGTMRVTDPTITTLTVMWDPADGNVQGYKVIYTPTDGGLEIVVRVVVQFTGVPQ